MELASTPLYLPHLEHLLPPLATKHSAVPQHTTDKEDTLTSVRLFCDTIEFNLCCDCLLDWCRELYCLSGSPAGPGSVHPKRSPSGVGEGTGLKEERLSVRKPSSNTVGTRSIPTPSSPMVSSAHNPNKAEIPDRRKELNSTTVRPKSWIVQCNQSVRFHFSSIGTDRWILTALLILFSQITVHWGYTVGECKPYHRLEKS